MKSYYYIKAPVKLKKNRTRLFTKRKIRIISFSSFLIGLVFLSFVAVPILSYQLKQVLVVQRNRLVIPVPEAIVLEAKGLLSPVQTVVAADGKNPVKQNVIQEKDYTMASNWFDSETDFQVSPSKTTHYFLSIPKLKIDQAVVTVGGEDLGKSLIQYPGTALPGQLGNVVILGHSVLPIFYNPEEYKTIFSKVPNLEQGDEIIIRIDGITYTYIVHDYYEKEPGEVELMEQKYDRYEMSLVTCVPQGTYLRRGVIRAYLKTAL